MNINNRRNRFKGFNVLQLSRYRILGHYRRPSAIEHATIMTLSKNVDELLTIAIEI